MIDLPITMQINVLANSKKVELVARPETQYDDLVKQEGIVCQERRGTTVG